MTPRNRVRNLENERALRELKKLGDRRDLLVAAHAIQLAIGYISPRTLPLLSSFTGIETNDVRERLDEAPGIRLEAPGGHQIRICTGRTCAGRGGARLLKLARKQLGIDCFETSPDGIFRLEPFRCFGQCARAPTVELQKKLQGAMTEKRFLLLLEMLRRTTP